MLRIYNSNFRTNKQRLIAAIVIGGIAAVLSAAILAFFCSKINLFNTIFDIAIAYIVSFAIKEYSHCIDDKVIIIGGIWCAMGMLIYEYLMIFGFTMMPLLTAPMEIFKIMFTMWFNVSLNGLLGLIIRAMGIYYGAYNSKAI